MDRQAGNAAGRLVALDLARTVALIGMAAFHFNYDLVMFGHLPPATVNQGFWWVEARLVAGSFLFLAGVSLILAHGQGVVWPKALRRLAMISGAAALITVGTFVAMPDRFIFFGILHSIAFASLVGFALVRAGALVLIGAAAGVLALAQWGQSEVFASPWLIWTGLSTLPPRTADFVPPFPWLAPFLLGMAAARIADRLGALRRSPRPPGPVLGALAWPGRHSLAIYLIHQPILIGLVWAYTQLSA